MGYIVSAILLLVLALAAAAVSFMYPKTTKERSDSPPYELVDKKNPQRLISRAIAGALIGILIVTTLVCSFARVGPREVAVETSFGKYSRTLGPGWQGKAPWAEVETFSTQLQRSELDAPVAFAESGGGTQHATVQWTISGDEAQALWSRYREFENVDSMLIQPSVKQAIGDVLASYTPAESRAEGAGEEIREKIADRLDDDLAQYGVSLDSVLLPPTALDDTAQAAYNRVVEAKANVERADERVEQAKLEAQADKARNAELTPENLVSQCLTLTNDWNDDENGPLPAGWNCFNSESTVDLVKPVN